MNKTLIRKKRRARFFKFLRFRKLPFLPYILSIEPGNICNLKCPLCPTGAGEQGLAKGFLEVGLFKEIFGQLKDALSLMNLYSWGEPLLNKDLVSIINYAKGANKNIRITLSTNLNVKEKGLLTELVASGIDEIIVSCDGAGHGTYSLYRVGGNFELVMDNLRHLAAIKEKLGKKAMIVWNFIVFRHNEHEIEKARKMAQALGVDFRVGLMRTSMKDEILIAHDEAIKKDIRWIPDNPKFSAYDKEKLVTKKIITTCRKPWQEISINWDGKVYPCCAIYGDKYTFGDATKHSIKQIWNNNMYRAARADIMNKRPTACTICGICRNNGFMHM